jgi:hypothetical protein
MTMSQAKPSRARAIAYWITTVIVAQENLAGAIWGVLHLEYLTANLKHLGYPDYFQYIVGFWQLLAALALIAPRTGLLKEWAYAGVFFNYSSAVASHVIVGDGPGKWIAPLIYAGFSVASWALRPADRRVIPATEPRPVAARTWLVPAGVLVLLGVVSMLSLPKGPNGW